MKQVTDAEFYSLRAHKGWDTRRGKKPKARPLAICPACQKEMPNGALEHERIHHVDLYARKAHKRGELL